MAKVKISALPEANKLAASDLLTAVSSSVSTKITVQTLSSNLTEVSSSISASYSVTSSYAQSGLSASYAVSSSYARSSLSSSYSITASYALNAGGGSTTPGGSNGQLQYNNSSTFGGVSKATFDGTNLTLTGSFSGSLVGNLTGTSSWSSNSVTASFVQTAQTASFVATASWSSNSVTSSFIQTAQTASYVLQAVSASFSSTGSFINPLRQTVLLTGSLLVSGSGEFRSGSLAVGNIAASATVGRIDASNDVVAFSTSDIRYKTNIVPIPNAVDKVNQIRGIHFDWVEDTHVHGNSGRDVGVIAQELEAILPEVVTTRENGVKAVKYDKIVPLLIEAIKDLQRQINELKARE
jgi:hypothetical protein